MNDLDQLTVYEQVDRAGMRHRLENLHDQTEAAYRTAREFARTLGEYSIKRIVVAAMGGSAMGAAFVQAAYQSAAALPVSICRSYDLPAWVAGAETLVIVSSKSGNTEETLSACAEAIARKCPVIALTTGGVLAEQARIHRIPCCSYTADYTPREAVAWLTMPLIAILDTLMVIPDPDADVAEACSILREGATTLGIGSPARRNPAKRLAGQLVQHLPIIYGSGILAPVAQRWKTVLNENAKMLAVCDELPELNHNTIVGFEHDEQVWRRSIVIQLRSDHDHPRVSRRFDLTTRLMLEAGINQDTVRARGRSALAQQMSLVQFGDWVSYYTAIMAGIDPTPAEVLDALKRELNG